MGNYKLKKGKTIHFKLKQSYKMPRCSGIIQHSSRRLVWVTLKEVQGKSVKENTICISKNNIF